MKIFCRDGKEIKNTSKSILSRDGAFCTLKIPNFTKAEAGVYKCVATNSAGTAECEAQVILYGIYLVFMPSFIYSIYIYL